MSNALAGRTADQLCLEACELGDEAIRIAFRANALALNDPRRWPLSSRMLEINHRLKEITLEISRENESRAVPQHTV